MKLHLHNQDMLFTEFSRRMEMIWRTTMQAYTNSIPVEKLADGKERPIPGKTGDIRILHAGADKALAYFDRLQSAGLLPTRTEKLEVQGEVEFKTWFKRILKRKAPKGGKEDATESPEGTA